MTPTTDDSGRWLEVAVAALTMATGVLSTLFWRLWATLATKTELERMKEEIMQADEAKDREMEDRLRQETLRLHAENQYMFKEIRDDVKELLRSGRK